LALVVDEGQQKQLAGNIGIASVGGLFVGARQYGLQLAADLDVAVGALHLRQGADRRVDVGNDAVDRHAGARQQAARAAVVVRKQGGQDVHRFDIGVVVTDGQALRIRDRLLELGREFVES